MKKRVRIKDIAERAGVSTGTVDRVLHKRGHVTEQKRQRIEAAMEELGYERNILASTLAYNRLIKLVALVPFADEDLYWQQVYQGMQKAAQSTTHYGLEVAFQHFELLNPRHFAECANRILDTPPAALLFPPLFSQESRELLARTQALEVPNVMINTMIPNDSSLCYIGQDSFQSGKLAARLLNYSLQDGQSVLILNLDKSTTNAQHLIDKELGFRTYFQQETDKAISLISEGYEDFAEPDRLKAFLQERLADLRELGGIFVTNSRAHLVVEALAGAIAPPPIVGFDLIEPNLQALRSGEIKFLINQNPEAQGYLGVMTIFQHLIRQVEVPKVQYLPLDIVVKENERYYPNMQLLPTVL